VRCEDWHVLHPHLPGCTHCYASTINKRFGNGLEYTVPNLEKVEFFIDERILEEPLRRKKPPPSSWGYVRFVPRGDSGRNDRRGFARCLQTPRHTFQFLTKRADRMQRVVSLIRDEWGPLPEHMWFGVSVEDKQRADERIPFLQATPVAVRFLSVEPLLQEVRPDLREINWCICGGESGPGARPFNLAWAESLRDQCQDAGVAFFMKQCGSNPCLHRTTPAMEKTGPGYRAEVSAIEYQRTIKLKDRKGAIWRNGQNA